MSISIESLDFNHSFRMTYELVRWKRACSSSKRTAIAKDGWLCGESKKIELYISSQTSKSSVLHFKLHNDIIHDSNQDFSFSKTVIQRKYRLIARHYLTVEDEDKTETR